MRRTHWSDVQALKMSQNPKLDDDTSAGAVTQGGDGKAKGRSIWWVLLAAVLAVALGTFAISLHKDAPAERGTTPVSKTAPL